MKYTDAGKGFIAVNGYCIPADPMNRDYRRIVQPYLDAGGVIADADPPPAAVKSARDAAIDALLEYTAGLVSYPQAIKDWARK